ncbi:HET-E1 [Symbiodinium necroappetens]|uniref:HET-E1 protein n=1 Tax=Symbiodinium necroappetens TaxID=1628268 RepID=A0A812IQ45_9DINO|nr:HET-E1 [Symbiodinium necroappetens]
MIEFMSSKRKAEVLLEDATASSTVCVRWAFSGDVLSVVSLWPGASVAELLESLPVEHHEVKQLRVIFRGRSLEATELLATLGTDDPDKEDACVFVVRRPPRLAILSSGKDSVFWEPEANRKAKSFSVREEAHCVTFSEDASLLLAGYSQGVARLYNEHGLCKTFSARCGSVLAVAFSSCGSFCITGSENGTARVWSTESGVCLRTLCRHSGPVQAASLSPDLKTAITGGCDELARLWCAKTGACLQMLRGHSGVVTCASFAGAERVVTASFDRSVKVWSCESGTCDMTLLGHNAPILSMAVCFGADCIVTGCFDGLCKVWVLATGSCSLTLEGHGDAVRSVAICPSGKHALSGDARGRLLEDRSLWEAFTLCWRTDYYRHDGVRITHDPYAPGMAEKYGMPGKTDNEGFDPYADTVGPGIYGGIVKRDEAGSVVIGRQYQNHNPRPGPVYAGGGYTPINEALRKGPPVLKPLLDKYPDLANDISTGGATPLHMCGMGRDNQHATEYLIRRGAKAGPSHERQKELERCLGSCQIEALDTYGMTPLHRMASNNLPVGAKALLEAGADPQNTGQVRASPMEIAQDSRAKEVMSVLAEYLGKPRPVPSQLRRSP